MTKSNFDIAILLYPGMTALDAIGPYEVLRGIPGARVRFVAAERGLVTTDSTFLRLNADHRFDEIEHTDLLVIPGGASTQTLLTDSALLDWVRRMHAGTKWTTSVCTGSFVLAAAGLLQGCEATTHWRVLDSLAAFGAKPVQQRVVRQGKIVMAAGVSAGIDMALELVAMECGADIARAIQLAIEYDPRPPFDSGSPATASPETVAVATAWLAAQGGTAA